MATSPVFVRPQETPTPEAADTLKRSGAAADKNFSSQPAAKASVPCDRSEKSWIELKLVDPSGNPIKNKKFKLKLPDGKTFEGTTDADGLAGIDNIDPGQCELRFDDFRFID